MIKHNQFKRLVKERGLRPTEGAKQAFNSLAIRLLSRACTNAEESNSSTLKAEHIERLVKNELPR